MPNHVYVRLTADRDVISSIWDNDEEVVDFNLVKPMPDEINPDSPDYVTKSSVGTLPDWYNWSVENWGTKWNAYDSKLLGDWQGDKGSCSVSFTTAWSSPEQFIIKLSQKFPEKDIDAFWEEEQGFGEEYVIRNGKRKGTISWDIPEYDEEDEEDAA